MLLTIQGIPMLSRHSFRPTLFSSGRSPIHMRSFIAACSLACTAVTANAASTDNPVKLDEVVVTASPIPHDADYLATIASSVDRDKILQQGGANLADALSNEPGISGSGFASGASRPVIRGFDSNRVRVMEDSIGSFDVSDVGPDHGVPIDPLSATRIEVVRGAATLRYGSQAIGGVVNAINNRVPFTLPTSPLSGEVAASYDDNANAKQGSLLMDAKAGHFALHADGFVRHTDDYDTPEGTQSNSYFKGDGYAGGGSYFFGDNRIGVGAVHYDSQYGIPSDTNYIDMHQTKGMFKSSFAVNTGPLQTVTMDAGYADYIHSERDPVTGEALATFKNREWDARAEGVFGKVGPFSGFALGTQFQQRHFSALGEGFDYLAPTATRSGAAFMFAEIKPAKKIDMDIGVRTEHVVIDNVSGAGNILSRRFSPLSASADIVIDATDALRVGLTLSSAARAPAQTELFAHGPHDGPGTFETGSPNLEIERANSMELSLRIRLMNLSIDTSIWNTRFNHYIYGQLTGRTCDDAGNCVDDESLDLRELNYVQVGAKFYGAETKVSSPLLIRSSGVLNATLFADYVNATTEDGEALPRITPYHIGTGLQWSGKLLDAGVSAKYTGKRNDHAFAETATAGFMSVDANIGWHMLEGEHRFDVTLSGHNLTNSIQRNAVALNKDVVVLPGRNLRLTLRAVF
ncbi:MAG TPA: TonB-dependent receptor [Steroidobacteraceae bacterium]|nr:TonB-dependent receptor [Steroidobacteraceae bacterium]